MFSYQPLVALRLLTIEAVVMRLASLFTDSIGNGPRPRLTVPQPNPTMDIPPSQWLQYASTLEHVCSCFWFSVVQERWHVLKDRVWQTFIPFYMILSSLRIQPRNLTLMLSYIQCPPPPRLTDLFRSQVLSDLGRRTTTWLCQVDAIP
jgi:hypothetical protein